MASTIEAGSLFDHIAQTGVDTDHPLRLYSNGDLEIHWLGIPEETAFRCNVYLIKYAQEAIVVDPGNRMFFGMVRDRVAEILPPEKVSGIIVCHQDPDVAASMVDWLDINPSMRVFTSPRTRVLLPHYGRAEFDFYDTTENPRFNLPSGGYLQFIEAPFLHFPGAIATFVSPANQLFSGDIWAALDTDWTLTVQSFEEHMSKMDLFHLDYMASNIAAAGFVKRLDSLKIDAILPQHGSIITEEHVEAALSYLANLRCGLDIIYADAS